MVPIKYSGRAILSSLLLIILFSCNFHSKNQILIDQITSSPIKGKPRLLVLTDIGGDPDDQQSLIRLLVYANEFDIEGIVVEGWKKYSGYDQIGLTKTVLTAYGKVRNNLLKHKSGYPTEVYLQSVLKRGVVDVEKPGGDWRDYVGEGKDTEGSQHIIAVLEKEDPRFVNIAVWGGTADLAQALWWLRNNRSIEEFNRIISKIRVHAIAHQDITGPWILKNFPDLFYILNLSPNGNKLESVFRGMYLGGDEQLTSLNWINEHIRKEHGPLGALYPSKTHTQQNPNGALKEGDTPSWFYFYTNGLNNPAMPEYGGWGGRFTPTSGYFNDTEDNVEDELSARSTVWRWRQHYQNDFQARMDWCIKSFDESNHNPVAVLNGNVSKEIIQISATADSEVTLNAVGSMDPDGDRIFFKWYEYKDAATLKQPEIKKINEQETIITVPEEAVNGEDIHIVLEVRDDGDPVLYAYRRVVITVGNDKDI